MAYMVELDVDAYGCLVGGEDLLPVKSIDHDWYAPYPTSEEVIPVRWEGGEEAVKSNVLWHPEIRDWVCDKATYELLQRVAPADIHLVARVRTSDTDEELFAIQVVGHLDVVDREASIIDRYPSYEVLQFPAFRRDAAEEVSHRIFRVPGAFTKIFLGESIKRHLDAAGVMGFRYVGVDYS